MPPERGGCGRPAPAEAPPCECCGERRHDAVAWKRGTRLVRCAACGLFFAWPQPPREELEGLYSTKAGYFAGDRDDLSATSPVRAESLDGRLLELGRHRGRLLDVGCGTGGLIFHMRSLGWDVTGTDINAGALEVARRHGLEVRAGRLEELAFQDEGFDVVHMGDLIEHVPSPRGLLREVIRILRPGGVAVLVTPNSQCAWGRATLMPARLLGIQWAHAEAPYHLYEFAPRNLAMLAESTGFELLSLHAKGAGSFPYLVMATGYFDELKRRIKLREGFVRTAPAWLRALPGLALVAGISFPIWALGSLLDRLGGSGCVLTAIAARPVQNKG